LNQELSEIENFVNKYPNDLAVNSTVFYKLVKEYQETTKLYRLTVQKFWQQIEQKRSSNSKNKLDIEALLTNLNQKQNGNINVKFEQLSDELIQIIGYTEIQKQKAKDTFSYAQALQLQIIIGSIIISALISALLAFYTARLIAHPLETVTKVAQQITLESNFKLRVNVKSNDEVSQLAHSLNQLVEWVGNYTHELKLARQTLEQKVEERTLELELARQTLEYRVEERTLELKQALKKWKETQAQLIQNEKMSSLGQMVAGIAHEINNPVNFIYGNIECTNEYVQDLLALVNLYQQEYPEANLLIEEKIAEIDLKFITDDLLNVLSSMKMGCKRIREIILSLRNFSRLDEAEMKEVDIHEGIDSTLLILNHKFKQAVEIIKHYGDIPKIECYPAQLNQVFMNILSNAIDALLECNNISPKQIVIRTFLFSDDYVQVSIWDNGPGIPLEIQNRLFDPFFTTKPVGKGTGLGLSISYQIMEKHKGKIEVVSETRQGTEFIISLPVKTQVQEENNVKLVAMKN
jgi:signal transduction histidine kinase